MTTQHTRLTLEDIQLAYQKGHITATGLLRFYLEIKLAYGWTQRFKPQEICKDLGIGKTSFYKALSSLKSDGFINFEVHGELSITNTNPSSCQPKNTTEDSRNPYETSVVRKCGKLDANANTMDANANTMDANANTMDANADNQSPKPASDKGCAQVPDLFQIYFKLFSPLLHPLLQEGEGDGNERLKKFFEWWISEGVRDCGFEIKNAIAYLNSEDSLLGTKRLFIQWHKWEQKNKPKTVDPEILELLNDPEMARFIKLD